MDAIFFIVYKFIVGISFIKMMTFGLVSIKYKIDLDKIKIFGQLLSFIDFLVNINSVFLLVIGLPIFFMHGHLLQLIQLLNIDIFNIDSDSSVTLCVFIFFSWAPSHFYFKGIDKVNRKNEIIIRLINIILGIPLVFMMYKLFKIEYYNYFVFLIYVLITIKFSGYLQNGISRRFGNALGYDRYNNLKLVHKVDYIETKNKKIKTFQAYKKNQFWYRLIFNATKDKLSVLSCEDINLKKITYIEYHEMADVLSWSNGDYPDHTIFFEVDRLLNDSKISGIPSNFLDKNNTSFNDAYLKLYYNQQKITNSKLEVNYLLIHKITKEILHSGFANILKCNST